MPALPVIAVFDVGKTNKKLLLFNEQYEVVYEQTARFAETADEDGFPCEDLQSLRLFVHESLHTVFQNGLFHVKAINVTAYGASFVYIDEKGKPVLPLYNYLKPYPGILQQQLHTKYGSAEAFAVATASPVLGSLNSGLQLYRIKHEQPLKFKQIKYALHLPQYLSHLITHQAYSDITSIGCHTALWDFEKKQYHDWVRKEDVLQKLPPVRASEDVCDVNIAGQPCVVGVGLHDSSAALIPYLVQFAEPFLLLSTGTWCIALNPFNDTPLTTAELQQDCLCYLDYKGNPVKAARLHLGSQYDAGIKRISAHFNEHSSRFSSVPFDATITTTVKQKAATWGIENVPFETCALHHFETDTEAYHWLLLQLVQQQYRSINLVLQSSIKQIFVDGGFSKNEVFMNLLAACFPECQVYAASMAQGTALGAALTIHDSWNKTNLPTTIVAVKRYACTAGVNL